MTTDTKYNGWANYETWNASMWINNEERLYRIAQACRDYGEFEVVMLSVGEVKTGDGVRWDNDKIDWFEMNEMLTELKEGA